MEAEATVINNTAGLGSEEQAEETLTPVEETPLFRWSGYVDLPEECPAEKEKRGSCKDPSHFHVWVRLPNKLQHKEIRDHAMAARARRARQLREEDSNSRLILEDQLDLLRESDVVDIVEEIVGRDSGKDLAEAIKDVAEIEADDQPEDGETVLKYAHIDKDEERLRELEALNEEECPVEEYEELLRHVNGYYKAIEERQREIQRPQRESLLDKDLDDLIQMVREDRIEAECMEEFLHTYNVWMMVYGTLLSDKSGRKFKHLDSLKDQSPEVVDALIVAFSALEAGAKTGNS